MALKDRLSITEVAKSVGVTPRTIMRWEKTGKIKRSKRDWRGWRFYQKEEVEEIKKFFESSYEYDAFERSAVSSAKDVLVALAIALTSAFYLYIGCGTCLAASSEAVMAKSGVVETSKTVDINLNNIRAIQPPPTAVAEASKYTLGPDDVIEIEVRRHPEFSGQYTVTAEGKIEYKFIGDVIVSGLTKVQLQERLTNILSEYIIEPELNVQIREYLSKVYYVIGEVNRPGKFYMKGNSITVREAIVQAGLPNQGASTRKCRLITPNAKGRDNIVYVNVYELLYGGNLKCNLEMKPGDVLYVPSTIIAKIIQIVRPVSDTVSSAAGSAAAGAALAL